MAKRIVVFVMAFALLAAAQVAAAERPAKISRIGFLSSVNPRSAPQFVAFFDELRKLGHVEGQNLAVEFRNAERQVERLPGFAAEFARLPVDVILAPGPEAVLRAARGATRSIPIVMVAINYDPIALGHVTALAKPGGNTTGVFLRLPDLIGKQLEVLKESLPGVTRVAAFWDEFGGDLLKAAEKVAPSLGLRLQPVPFRNPPYDYEGAFAAAARGRAEALLLVGSPVFFRDRARLMALAAQNRLPLVSSIREYPEVGGLMSYGVNFSEMFRRSAHYVDKILKGAKPADLPVEQPTKFELVINLKTAKELGLTITPEVLSRADRVIR
jgi:putative ABC transport system substrate-binding protein